MTENVAGQQENKSRTNLHIITLSVRLRTLIKIDRIVEQLINNFINMKKVDLTFYILWLLF